MKTIRCIVMLALLFLNVSVQGHEDDTMTRMDTVPTQGVTARITSYVREHAFCMLALTAALGYIYVNSVLESMKPNPYEGPLAEAHAHIAELEAAMLKYEQIYRLLKPVLRSLPQ